MNRLFELPAHHPEWWALGASLICWSFLLLPLGNGGCLLCQAPDSQLREVGAWLLMVIAMMLPLIVIPIRTTAFNSLWRRRHWAILVFLTGYLAMWAVAGIVWATGILAVRGTSMQQSQILACLTFLAAAAWQRTSLKRRALVACHRTRPLAPIGWQADRDCLRFGIEHGFYCIANCGILMLAAMLSPWPTAMMLAVTFVLLYERYRAKFRDKVVPIMICLFGVGQIIILK